MKITNEKNMPDTKGTGDLKSNRHFIPLSWEHHYGLVLAQRMRLGLKKQTEPAVVASYLLHFWTHYIQPHFETEETLLLPAMRADHPVISRLQKEHKDIRGLVGSIQEEIQSEKLAELLQSFADQLTSHIRYEEKTVFPLAEELIPEETLTRIDHTLHSAFQKIEDHWTPEFWKREGTWRARG